MAKQERSIEECVTDAASVEILKKAQEECIDTCFSRADAQSVQCKFGKEGICCRICYMGPCRITPKSPYGICGADAATIVARNFLREVVGGTAAHSDHGRHLVLRLKKVAQSNGSDYEIKDERALRYTARLYGIEEVDRSKEQVALDLADLFLKELPPRKKNSKPPPWHR
jgi:carbon-monoxide dehydrogenase catalytic subunit